MTKQTRYLESFQGSGYTHYTEEYRKTEIFISLKVCSLFMYFITLYPKVSQNPLLPWG